jgi:YfiH family protein
LEKIPFLIHGFGTIHWNEDDFKKNPGWRNFRLITLIQIHSDIVRLVEKNTGRELRGDAMITAQPLRFLVIKSADCLPVFLVDEEKRVIAACHCGWRGTHKRVIQQVIKSLIDQFRCSVSSLLVGMGPCIGRECYEVGEEVLGDFKAGGLSLDSFLAHPDRKGKYCLDLKQANVSQLVELGIQESNIHSLNICTHCQNQFSSYRRDRKKNGRMLSFIGMED